jgi:hypothetical protein
MMSLHVRLRLGAAALTSLLAVTACSTDEISSRATDARSSAAAVASAARNLHSKEVCAAVHDELGSLGSLAGRLAADPSLRVQLAPQVTAAIGRLTDKIGSSSAQWRDLLDGANGLGDALRTANEATVRLTASQVVLAVRVAQAGCAVASR